MVKGTFLGALTATIVGGLDGAVKGAALGPIGIAGYILNLIKMYLLCQLE